MYNTLTSEELIKQEFSKERQDSDKSSALHVVPGIDDKLLIKSLELFKDSDFNIDAAKIIAILNSNTGFTMIFTGLNSYIRYPDKSTVNIDYTKIISIELDEAELTNPKLTIINNEFKETELTENILGQDISIYFLNNLFEGLLRKDVQKISYKQYSQFEHLSDESKFSYFKYIIHYLKADDGKVDINETKELATLMAQLRIDEVLSKKIREYKFLTETNDTYESILSDLKQHLQKENIYHIPMYDSLALNILSMNSTEKLKQWESNEVLLDALNNVGVDNRKTIKLIRMIIKQREMLIKRLDNDSMKAYKDEILALASSAGVSLVALATIGTMTGVGFSVSGGLLGLFLSGGTLIGVAAVAMAGYGVYKGVKHLQGTSELEKYSIQIEALENKIKILHRSQIFILEDIEFQTTQLEKLVFDINTMNDKNMEIQTGLINIITQLKNSNAASKESVKESDDYEYACALRAIPEELDLIKYNSVIDKSLHKAEYDELLFSHVYIINENKGILKDNHIEIEYLIQVKQILDEIGYYSMTANAGMITEKTTNVIKDQLSNISGSDIAKKGLGSLKSFMRKGN